MQKQTPDTKKVRHSLGPTRWCDGSWLLARWWWSVLLPHFSIIAHFLPSLLTYAEGEVPLMKSYCILICQPLRNVPKTHKPLCNSYVHIYVHMQVVRQSLIRISYRGNARKYKAMNSWFNEVEEVQRSKPMQLIVAASLKEVSTKKS